jgi:large subunit ribosomal protein L34e
MTLNQTISMLDHVTDRTLHRYNTRSNKTRVIKTPGGALRLLHIKKRGTAPKCGDCGIKLPGVRILTLYTILEISTKSYERY